MGSRARAHEGEDTIPGADDFWGEGAAAVHGAIQPSARHVDGTATAPAPRVRARQPRARRPWGFSARSAPHRVPVGQVRVRPRMAVLGIAVACLVAAAAIGLAEGGGHRSPVAAIATRTASGAARELGRTAGGLPVAGLLASARIARADLAKEEAAAATAAAARAKHRRLARENSTRARARARRREAATHHTPTTSRGAPVTSSVTSPAQTAAPPAAPTTTTSSATSAGSSGSSGTHATSTHHSAFGQSGLLGAGHSSGDS